MPLRSGCLRLPPTSGMTVPMSVRTCFILACLIAASGAGLRLAVPVRPVDEAYRTIARDVLVLRRLVEERDPR